MIYCGAKSAARFDVFLHLLNHRTVKYASFAHAAKTPNLTPSSAPRDENRSEVRAETVEENLKADGERNGCRESHSHT